MPKTVRVRIAVGVSKDGSWRTHCYSGESDAEKASGCRGARDVVWVEADVPLPEETTVEGEVTDELA